MVSEVLKQTTGYPIVGATRAAQQQLLMKEATSGVTQSAPAVNMPAATVPLPEVALGAGGIGTPGETPWPEVVFGTTATTFDLNQYIADEIARFNAPVQDAPWPDVIGFELPVRDPNLAVADILVAEYAALQPKVLEGARLQALNETFPPVSGDWLITQALIEAHAAEQANLAKGAAMHGLNETYPTGTEAPGTAPDLGGIR